MRLVIVSINMSYMVGLRLVVILVELPRGVKGTALVENALFLPPSCAGVKDGESTFSDFLG